MNVEFVKGDVEDISTIVADAAVSFAAPDPVYTGECGRALFQVAGIELREWNKLKKLHRDEVGIAPSVAQRTRYILFAVQDEADSSKVSEKRARKYWFKILQTAEKLGCKKIVFSLPNIDSIMDMFALIEILRGYQEHEESDMDVLILAEDETTLAYYQAYYTDTVWKLYDTWDVWNESLQAYFPDTDEDWNENLRTYFPDADEADWDYAIETTPLLQEGVPFQTAQTWQECFCWYLDAGAIEEKDLCKRAVMDNKLLSKIRADIYYHPNKKTVIALAVALRLNLSQTEDFLERAGYAFSPCDRSDLIVKWFIVHENYDMDLLNEMLERFGMGAISITKC